MIAALGCDAVELHALCAVLIIIRLSLGGENEAVVVLAQICIEACAVFELNSDLTYLATCEQTVCGEVRLGLFLYMRDSGQLSVEYVALGGIPYPHELLSAAVVELKADDNITFAVAVDIVKRDTFKRLFCVGDALGKQHAVKEHLLGGVTVKREQQLQYLRVFHHFPP